VNLSGGGGTGAVAIAHMSGTMVESVVITNGGTGYTSAPVVTISGNAQAAAGVYSGGVIPTSFVRSRFNDLYGFDGMGRGLRWNGTAGTMQPIGLRKPYKGPAVTIASTAMGGYVDSITVVSPGSGYNVAPKITFTGGTPTKTAVALAEVMGGVIAGVTVTDPGAGYQAAPQVSLTSSNASGSAFNVNVRGQIQAVTIISNGSGYTSQPTVVFSTGQGLLQANANAITSNGSISNINLLSAGTGATTAVTATVTGGGGTGAALLVGMQYGIQSVTVSNGGTGFQTPPIIQFLPDKSDTTSVAAAATAAVSGGAITGITVTAGGFYSAPPTVFLGDYNATATATISNVMRGTYKCAMRYFDDTPEKFRGPVYSSISELVEVKMPDGASSLTWTLAHSGLDDRVAGVELWRTTADQSVLLFRVAKILRSAANFSGTYTDTFTDDQLSDDTKDGYGLLPVTLPSGQINARRFGVPPANFSVACMFQDRCWLGVDTTGEKPNSLYYSEVDEPESIPMENEIVVQENAGDSDAIVALIPLGASLLAVQTRHIYRIQYVAQPVLDASIMLTAYRGILNSRCWDVMGGVAFIADSYGVYAFDGRNDEAVSVPIDNLFRNGHIDFAKSSQFFVRADIATKVVRFFYCRSTDSLPVHALCYCAATKTWWREGYSYPVTAAAPYASSGKQGIAYGLGDGSFATLDGYSDRGAAIPYVYQTGNMLLAPEEGRRGVSVTYTPTAGDSTLALRRHFNGSASARQNAAASDRGDGFVSQFPGTDATLNMKLTRSALGDAVGVARAMFSGGNEERSGGADRHIAVAFSGTQSTSSDAPAIHSITIEGAQ